MDFAHLETLLSSLEPKPQKIRSLVDYILLNSSSSEQQVGNALQKAFNSMLLDQKLAIFFTISEILLISSQKRQVTYFKVLGTKIKTFIESLSMQVKDVNVMKDICRTLDKWQSEEMFAGNFMEKLKVIVKDFYTRIREQSNEQERMMGFKKYKKTFLMEINDLKNFKTSYEVYQNYCEYVQVEQKLTNLNLEFNKIDFDKGNENAEIRQRCMELLKLSNELREKLENSLFKIQNSFNNMKDWAMEEYEIVKKEAINNGDLKRSSTNLP